MIFRVFFVDMSGGRGRRKRAGWGGRTQCVFTNSNPIPKLRSKEVKADVDSLTSLSIISGRLSILNL